MRTSRRGEFPGRKSAALAHRPDKVLLAELRAPVDNCAISRRPLSISSSPPRFDRPRDRVSIFPPPEALAEHEDEQARGISRLA
jgi:hypothetical protein